MDIENKYFWKKNNEIIVYRDKAEEVSGLLQQGISCVLSGPNNVGKDFFMKDVCRRLELCEYSEFAVKGFLKTEEVVEETIKGAIQKRRESKEKKGGGLFLTYPFGDSMYSEYVEVKNKKKKVRYIRIIKKLYRGKKTYPRMVLMINQFNIILNRMSDIQKKQFLSDLKELMDPELYPRVSVLLLSRYPMEQYFSNMPSVVLTSLGGLTKSERDVFFSVLYTQYSEKLSDGPSTQFAEYWEEIKRKFDKYAGGHPYLLNGMRQILLDMEPVFDEKFSEKLEEAIVEELRKEVDSNLGRVYFTLDELLEKENYTLKENKTISGRKLYIQAFSENSGFTEQELSRWQKLLFDKGYALQNEDGTYAPLSPYMVEYLDKWRVQELDRLMQSCDEVELALRALIVAKMKQSPMLTEQLETPWRPEQFLRNEYLRTGGAAKESGAKASKVELVLNKHVDEEDAEIYLAAMSFDQCYNAMNRLWEFPHFAHFTKKGEYEALFESMNYHVYHPALWKYELADISEDCARLRLAVKRGVLPNVERIVYMKQTMEKICLECANFSNKAKAMEKEVNSAADKLLDAAYRIKQKIDATTLDAQGDDAADISLMESCAEQIIYETKDAETEKNALDVLEYLKNKDYQNAVETGIKLEENLLRGVADYLTNTYQIRQNFEKIKNILDQIQQDLENGGSANNIKAKLKLICTTIAGSMVYVDTFHEKLVFRLDQRRISLNRVRNLAKHRNSLELLNIRRYTGLMKECRLLLEDMGDLENPENVETALTVPKLNVFYQSFRIPKENLCTEDKYIKGYFIPKNEELPIQEGLILRSELANETEEKTFSLSELKCGWNPKVKQYVAGILPPVSTGAVQATAGSAGSSASPTNVPVNVPSGTGNQEYAISHPCFSMTITKHANKRWSGTLSNGENAALSNFFGTLYKTSTNCAMAIGDTIPEVYVYNESSNRQEDGSYKITYNVIPKELYLLYRNSYFSGQGFPAGMTQKVTDLLGEMFEEDKKHPVTSGTSSTVSGASSAMEIEKVAITLTDLEIIKTKFLMSSTDQTINITKTEWETELKDHAEVLSQIYGGRVTGTSILSGLKAIGYRNMIGTSGNTITISKPMFNNYYNILRRNKDAFSEELTLLETVFSDPTNGSVDSLSIAEFEKRMKEERPREQENDVKRMVDRFRIQGMAQNVLRYYILNKNDSNQSVDINWDVLDEYRSFLWNNGGETE